VDIPYFLQHTPALRFGVSSNPVITHDTLRMISRTLVSQQVEYLEARFQFTTEIFRVASILGVAKGNEMTALS
jgi:hypothetical protein